VVLTADFLTDSQRKLLLEEDDTLSVTAMSKFYEKYEMGEKIGEGAHGLVKKCYLVATGEVFAVKAMTMDE
jgi:hypothetical protein